MTFPNSTFHRFMKYSCPLYFLSFLLLIVSVNAKEFAIENKGDTDMLVATAVFHKTARPGLNEKDAVVLKGWFTLRPRETKRFDMGDGDVYIATQPANQISQFPVSDKIAYWVPPTGAFEARFDPQQRMHPHPQVPRSTAMPMPLNISSDRMSQDRPTPVQLIESGWSPRIFYRVSSVTNAPMWRGGEEKPYSLSTPPIKSPVITTKSIDNPTTIPPRLSR